LKDQHRSATDSYTNRQRALDALADLCRELKICAACGTSAGLYLAAEAAFAIGYDRAAFVEFAAMVWEDLVRQRSASASN
jgi:fructoselysine-6-P-deglycase FrlB-like protein